MRTYRTISRPAVRTPGVSRRVAARRLAARTFVLAAGVAGVVYGYVQLTTTGSLAIRHILVEGTGPERAEEIRALLNVKPGDNLLFADLTLAQTRAMTHPWVSRVAVTRELPDTLRIVVEERSPVLILALDRLYYVDDSGEAFKAVQPGDVYDLPVLTGLTRDDVLTRAGVARDAILGALRLLASLATKGSPLPPPEISEIAWDEDEGYSVVTVSGRLAVRFGRGNFEERLARLAEVRAAGEKDAAEIDLTYSSRVIVAR